jgi:hypothetical protein
MNEQTEFSGRDETLAAGLFTGAAEVTVPQVSITHFEYVPHRKALLDGVKRVFGSGLARALPPDHRALLEKGEEQSAEDIALARQMLDIQRDR